MPAEPLPCCLEVRVRDLTRAAKRILRAEPKEKWLRIAFVDDCLQLVGGPTKEAGHADGSWIAEPREAPARAFRAFAKSLPRGVLTTLRIEVPGRLKIGELSVRFRCPDSTIPGNVNMEERIDRAHQKLGVFGVSRDQISQLVSAADPTCGAHWQGGYEERVPVVVAYLRAWMRFGIEASDIRRLMDESLRQAFLGPTGNSGTPLPRQLAELAQERAGGEMRLPDGPGLRALIEAWAHLAPLGVDTKDLRRLFGSPGSAR